MDKLRLFSLLGLLLALAMPALAQSKKSGTPVPTEPKAVIEWAIKAHGGDEKLAKATVGTRKLRCRVSIPEVGDIPYVLESTWMFPDKYRAVFQSIVPNAKNELRVTVLNEDKGWSFFNNELKDLTTGQVAGLKQQAYVENLCRLLPLRETGYEFMMLDETKVDNKPLVGLNVQAKGKRDVNLYFDKATGLLTKMETSIQTADGTHASQEVFFLDYRDTVGPKHWGRLVVYTQNQKLFEAEVAEIRYVEKIRDDLFARPITKDDKKQTNSKP